MRASRLVSILLLLQARGRMTAAALAEELEVSVRTVYRDLVDLGAAGVPVYGERGGGGYRLVGGYRTNLTGLTAEEAQTLLLAGAAGPLAELGLGSLLATTRMKLLAAVPEALRPVAARAERRFHLDASGWAHAPARDPGHLRAVAGAVWRDHRLGLRYRRGDDRPRRRLVDPLGLVHKTGTWYLVAAAAGDRLRVYRVDRIQAAGEVDAQVRRPDSFDLARLWREWEAAYAAGLPTFTVTVRLGPVGQRHQGSMGPMSHRSASDPLAGGDGWVTQRLTFDDRRVALAALQALGPDVEVLDPPDLRGDLVANARALIDRNRRPGPAALPDGNGKPRASPTVDAMAILVRPARTEDAADLARGWTDVARHYLELDPDAFQLPRADGLVAWFERLLARPRPAERLWLVAEVDGRVVGDVLAHLEPPASDADRQLLSDLARTRLSVDALGVEAAHRRRGVGRRLMEEVERWARDRGAGRAVLTTHACSPCRCRSTSRAWATSAARSCS
jgi:predicted DNA-binding transcriptional regulator YafY/GNAT superfamily N-acetyltransferase